MPNHSLPPNAGPVASALKTTARSRALLIGLFAVVVFILHFAAARSFLLYEDDYFCIGIPATQTPEWGLRQIVFVSTHWPQGRPAMFVMLALQGLLVNASDSLLVGYLPSFLILTANGYLVYRLLRTKFSSYIAVTAALFGTMSCADPHKILLTHAPLQFAILLNLVGLLLYQRGRYVDAYVIAASSLFFYEISFALFAGAELFYQLRGRLEKSRLAWSFGGWIGIAGAVLALRLLLGESRAIDATGSLTALVQRVVTNVTWGPLYGLENSYVHPLRALARDPSVSLFAVSLGLAGSVFFGSRYAPRRESEGNTSDAGLNPWVAAALLVLLAAGPYAMQLGRTVFAGLNRPVTGYHLGAGVALAFGAALALSNRRLALKPWACRGGLALLAVASCYQNLLIQRDYVRSGRYQAHFWSEVKRLAADAPPASMVLVPESRLQESEYIASNAWGVAHGWQVFFDQTGPLRDWFNVPNIRPVTVFLVPPDWANHVESAGIDHFLKLDGYTPPGFKLGEIPLSNHQFIVLEGNGAGPFRRLTDGIQTPVGGLFPAPIPATSPPVKLTGLGRYVFAHFID